MKLLKHIYIPESVSISFTFTSLPSKCTPDNASSIIYLIGQQIFCIDEIL